MDLIRKNGMFNYLNKQRQPMTAQTINFVVFIHAKKNNPF